MTERTWEELTIQDNFIFGKSMETAPEICKWILEKTLRIKIREIHPMMSQLDEVVQKVKRNKEWRDEYMRYEQELVAREYLAREESKELTLTTSLRNIIKNTKSSVDEAMNILEIPTDDRPKYLSILGQFQ